METEKNYYKSQHINTSGKYQEQHSSVEFHTQEHINNREFW